MQKPFAEIQLLQFKKMGIEIRLSESLSDVLKAQPLGCILPQFRFRIRDFFPNQYM